LSLTCTSKAKVRPAGASAGIILGGISTQFVDWRAIFLVNPPLIVALIIAIRRMPPTPTRRLAARLYIAGAILATTSIALLILGLSQVQQHGLSHPAAL